MPADISPPKILYLQPLTGCTAVTVTFQGNSCTGSFNVTDTTGTTQAGTFKVEKPANVGPPSCSNAAGLNPEIQVQCTSGAVATVAIHTSCSQALQIGDEYPDPNPAFRIAGFENPDGTQGFKLPGTTTTTPAT